MSGRIQRLLAIIVILGAPDPCLGISGDEIVAASAQIVHRDWERAPNYEYCARAPSGNGTTTTAVLMLDGSPYYRLVARNGIPLSATAERDEQSKFEAAVRERDAESTTNHDRRIADYAAERLRNQLLLEEFTKATQFELAGTATVGRHETYVIRAKPRPGYRPKSKETKVLTGMVGTMWIDRETLHWVRVEAEVTKSVAVVGFVATVQPGTRFEFEQTPIDEDTWLHRTSQ